MTRLRLEVITPRGPACDTAVDAVTVPVADGWIGILPGHSPFIARLMRGLVVYRNAGGEQTVATIGGVVSVGEDRVTVLTGVARTGASYAELEQSIGDEGERIRSMEIEAERHFDRIYRALADTFRPRGRGDA